MVLKDNDIRQMDKKYLSSLEHATLIEVASRLLDDIKETRERLNRTSENSSRPPSSQEPWFNTNDDKDDKEVEDKELWLMGRIV